VGSLATYQRFCGLFCGENPHENVKDLICVFISVQGSE
jgi:hypothetical protein